MFYSILRNIFPGTAPEFAPKRIVFVRPCCIGDAVMATAALAALRESFPEAHISWAVGPWSARAIAHHPAIDEILDIGIDMPLRSPTDIWRFVRLLRRGGYDLAVSLVRSPLMSLAIYLSGIPVRAGLDSGGRGFAYNLRVPIDPTAREHEGELYLKVISAAAGRDLHAYANLPVTKRARASVRERLAAAEVSAPYIVAHPGGGSNPGTNMASKRYPPAQLAKVLNRVAAAQGASVILIGGPHDAELVDTVRRRLQVKALDLTGAVSFQEIGALAAQSLFYIGNDSGLTHLAAASGAVTVMLMGPTDPLRYAPFTPNSLALWKPSELRAGTASARLHENWDWARDGIAVDDAVSQILAFLATTDSEA